jgi:hypothetical protein
MKNNMFKLKIPEFKKQKLLHKKIYDDIMILIFIYRENNINGRKKR